ncbi:MAG: hypothetical protein ABIO05_06185, partial [Ferruginibacter sp.]
RTKTNVPLHIRNCFQTHRLTYAKEGTAEVLNGNWVPAPNQNGDCGFGVTNLNRRVLQNYRPLASKTVSATAKKTMPLKVPPKAAVATKPIVKKVVPLPQKEIAKDVEIKKELPVATAPNKISSPDNTATSMQFAKRNTSVLKTLEIASEFIKVDLYDNGEIDGDSVSLIYNGKLLASKKRLTEKPLSFNLLVDKDVPMNELIMFAENLGSIPPNTALMIVTDGTRRYEVRITSDLQKSGVIHFVHQSRVQ